MAVNLETSYWVLAVATTAWESDLFSACVNPKVIFTFFCTSLETNSSGSHRTK